MVWGAIIHNKLGILGFINKKMNSSLNIVILMFGYLEKLEDYAMSILENVLQQKNDTRHFSSEIIR